MEKRLLCNTFIFSENSLEKLKKQMYEKKVNRGQSLFEQGDIANKLYFLYEGKVTVSKVIENGKILSFYQFSKYDLFGQYGYIEGRESTFVAKAMTDCKIGVIFKRDLETLLWNDPRFSFDFMNWMGYMQQLTETKLRDLLFFGKIGALASTLIRMSNTYGKKVGNMIYIQRKFTNAEIADLIGATRETVNRMLHQLKQELVLEYDKGLITILNMETLRDLCHCEGCPHQVCRL